MAVISQWWFSNNAEDCRLLMCMQYFRMHIYTYINIHTLYSIYIYDICFPTCQVRVVRFYVRCAAPPVSCLPPSFLPRLTSFASSWSQWSSPDLICQLLIAVVGAGPLLPALDRSGSRRTSSASSWSQWASPDFNRWESDRCGPRQTSTGESRSAVGLAGLQPARVWALWASPDFNRRESERCGPRRTSTGESLSAVGLAGLQPDLNGHKQSHIEFQRECQIECQIDCQKICQIEFQKICQIECQMGWIECQGGDHSKQSIFFICLHVITCVYLFL